MTAVLENPGQRVERSFAVAGLVVVGDLPVDADEVELVGQVEPLDARGQARDGLVVLERVNGVRSAFVFVAVAAPSVQVVRGHGLDAELVVKERGELREDLVGSSGSESQAFGQQPAPAFPVGLCFVVAGRYPVKDGVSVLVHGGPPRAAVAVAVPVFVVGQRGEVRQVLQSPRFIVPAVSEQDLGGTEVEVGDFRVRGFSPGPGHGVVQELQRAHAVAFEGVHVPAAAAVVAALEFARHDIPIVRGAEVAHRGLLEEMPVAGVGFYGFFAERVRFVAAVQVLEAGDRHVEIVLEAPGIELIAEHDPAVDLVGFLVVSVTVQAHGLVAAFFDGEDLPGIGRTEGQQDQRNAKKGGYDGTCIHGSLLVVETFPGPVFFKEPSERS